MKQNKILPARFASLCAILAIFVQFERWEDTNFRGATYKWMAPAGSLSMLGSRTDMYETLRTRHFSKKIIGVIETPCGA